MGEFRPYVPDRRELFHYPIRHQFLTVDATDSGSSAVLVNLLLNPLWGVNLMEFIDRTEVRIAGVSPSHTGWISDHGFEFLPNNRFGI